MEQIPRFPTEHVLDVKNLWNGLKSPDDRLWGKVFVSQSKEGLHIRAEGPIVHEQKVPDVPIGSRVEGLWEYDVIELFLVGPGHEYLEIELGAGGHFLVLGFDSIRHRANEYDTFRPILRYEKTAEKIWKSSITIPPSMFFENLRAFNAFAIMSGQFLAHSPVPGIEPDFHQPDSYPSVCW